MKKILKIAGIGMVVFIGALIIVGVIASSSATKRLSVIYDVLPVEVEIPEDSASLEEGERLVSIYCVECHGKNLQGKNYSNDGAFAILDSPNLTTGDNGVGAYYENEDWVRSIRHGVNPDGRPLFLMPSSYFNNFSNDDLGQIIAYIKSVEPQNFNQQETTYGFLGKVLLGLGMLEEAIGAEFIDHDAPAAIQPEPSISIEYGEYLVNTFRCKSCHGEYFEGMPAQNPGDPDAPNLTQGGQLSIYTPEIFVQILRARKSEIMPFEYVANFSDEELNAIWVYLESLPILEVK